MGRADARAPFLLSILAVAGCGSDWPDGAMISVEQRWCQGPCEEVELLERRRFDNGNLREVWYIFVWTRPSEGWRVGMFAGEGDGWNDYYVADGDPTDRWFDHVPTLEEVIDVRNRAAVGIDLICGDLFLESWKRAVGGTIDVEYPEPCD